MRLVVSSILAMAALLAAQSAAVASADGPSAFDGKWNVTLECPTFNDGDDFAKGYKQSFAGEVKDGALRATHGRDGEPGWHLLSGTIAPDGKADLKLDGIISSQRHAVNDAQRGKPYTYRVRAQFEPTKGTGVRVGKRKCGFTFTRR